MNASDMDEVVKEFLVESYENLDRMDGDLVALETDPSSRDRLGSVFRTIHTIKGTCGFLGFGKLEALAHAGESLLSLLRDGTLVLDREIATGLLAMVDATREMLASIEAAGNEGGGDYATLIERLTRLQRPGPGPRAGPEPATRGGGGAPPVPPSETAGPGHALADATIRVDVGVLDRLVDLVGELVLARNQVVESAAAGGGARLMAVSQRLDLLTSELQDGILKTRMQPIRHVFDKFPRVVRDLATACGKRARVEIEGRDTELDKTIIEAIRDPLTHVVRNAIDHGIETPEERSRAGKPAEGRLLLRAFHEGGLVNIEIGDDGRGIDP
jgi:two-component system chemotaxis sensor kinase CheA